MQLVLATSYDRLVEAPTARFVWSNEFQEISSEVLAARDPHHSLRTILYLEVPEPPRWWPPWQSATLQIQAEVAPVEEGPPATYLLYIGRVSVSVHWFAVAATLAVVAFVYPGISGIVWALRRRRFLNAVKKAPPGQRPKEPPSFWDTLDPVQLTAGVTGRGSLSKLQIFGFSLIIFGLLLYTQIRVGLLMGLSTDILYLLGISAGGAAVGKATAIAKRRLSFVNWAWLRQKRWIQEELELARRAHWRDLITDGRELDVYRFQMAIFSIIIAVALLTAGLIDLATFEIPEQLLVLLGISQVVYVGGKAIEPRTRAEFDEKLDEVRTHEQHFRENVVQQWLKNSDIKHTLEVAKSLASEEYERFRTSVDEAAEMFRAIYGDEVPEDRRIPSLPVL